MNFEDNLLFPDVWMQNTLTTILYYNKL